MPGIAKKLVAAVSALLVSTLIAGAPQAEARVISDEASWCFGLSGSLEDISFIKIPTFPIRADGTCYN